MYKLTFNYLILPISLKFFKLNCQVKLTFFVNIIKMNDEIDIQLESFNKASACELLDLSISHSEHKRFRHKRLFILVKWTFFTLVCGCAGSYFVIKNALDFLKYSTVTKIEVIDEKQVIFSVI